MAAADRHAFRPMPATDDAPPSTPPDARRVNSPDLAGQLRAVAAGAKVTAVVCSALDTDPAVPLNAAVTLSATDDVLAGVGVLAALAPAARVLFVADPESAVWDHVRRRLGRGSRVHLAPLHADYPQAHPSLLAFSLLRRRVPPDALPTDHGLLLVDAAAAADVGRPATTAAPVAVAIRDHFARATHLLAVPAGTPLADVLRFAGVDPAAAVRAGEFLRDAFVAPDRLAVTAAGERTFHVSARVLAANPDPCVRCGWCVEACPTRVHPAGLLDAAQQADPALAARHGLPACIECGICSYVCPTRLPLLTAIRHFRQAVGGTSLTSSPHDVGRPRGGQNQ